MPNQLILLRQALFTEINLIKNRHFTLSVKKRFLLSDFKYYTFQLPDLNE